MDSIIGFTVFSNLAENRIKALQIAENRALVHFTHLQRQSLVLGPTHLELWGRKGMEKWMHTLPDGSLAVVIGSPHGRTTLMDIQDSLLSNDFELPWDGRVILLRISADGKQWTIWNDWLGSIPVFHAEIEQGRIASTLEPATVAAAGYAPDDFFIPGLVSLLVYGHFISDWTLYKNMKIIPPDSVMEWGEKGFHSKRVWAVKPSRDRWEESWDDLVDEMHALSHQVVADVLKTQSDWALPLSSGLDSRLIAAIGSDVGAKFRAYAWGEPESTDVIYSRKVARTLGIPWKHIRLPEDFLARHTPLWSDLFGSSMHFHGMYQIGFLEAIKPEPEAPLIIGYIGDILSGGVSMEPGPKGILYREDWYLHWDTKDVGTLFKIPLSNALQEVAEKVAEMADLIPGPLFAKALLFDLWNRQRLLASFQSTLSSYWRGLATPFLNRTYARFCMSLPRTAHERRLLMGDVFRRYYGKLAVIPGTYASQPYILTGRHLLKRRIVQGLPSLLHHGPLTGMKDVPLRMDIDCIQATGKESLWPIYDAWNNLGEWLDTDQIEVAYQAVMHSAVDIRPLRKLQSIQTLAYRLLNHKDATEH